MARIGAGRLNKRILSCFFFVCLFFAKQEKECLGLVYVYTYICICMYVTLENLGTEQGRDG